MIKINKILYSGMYVRSRQLYSVTFQCLPLNLLVSVSVLKIQVSV